MFRKFCPKKDFNYIGFVECNGLFNCDVDLVGYDVFTVNVVLKAVGGVLRLLVFYAQRNIISNMFTIVAIIFEMPILKKLNSDLDLCKYNCETFVSLRGIVIKSHGRADTEIFYHSLEKQVLEAEKNVPHKVHDELMKTLKKQVH